MSTEVTIDIRGAEAFAKALKEFRDAALDTVTAAGREAAAHVIGQVGLQRYPPADGANAPGRVRGMVRLAWYKRGIGTQVPVRDGGYKSLDNSERYGTQFTTAANGLNVVIGNRASYAKWLGGPDQSKRMAARGWRRLSDVVVERLEEITRIYNAWIDRLIKQKGL